MYVLTGYMANGESLGNLLPGLVISEGGVRFERARDVLRGIGFDAVQMPAVFVPSTLQCQGTNGHRLAMRNAWAMIAMANFSMGLFEDDVCLVCSPSTNPHTSTHAKMTSCTRLLFDQVVLPPASNPVKIAAEVRTYLRARAQQHADLAYLGHLQGFHGKWANHAIWTTPRAASFLLHNTVDCIRERGISIDTFMGFACSSKNLSCAYPVGHRGQPMAGGRVFVGFFHQDRKHLISYLHRDSNKLRKGDPVPQLLVRREGLPSSD